ncbi:MAG: LON peptidase substrate-binding domain-containing protein [Rhodospirillales bacterium]|nr:LON peptidase substrate-binding domain-containing protein [Rhodospirillales bacterium]
MPTTAGRLTLSDMPATLPVFPLTGVLLLPRGRLPLNVFEPRYLAMVEDVLGTQDKLIGMIQPTEKERKGAAQPLYPVGCAGRITSWSETEDGRFLIQLSGIARFAIGEEIATTRGYRRFRPDFGRFAADFEAPDSGGFDRKRLLAALKAFFAAEGLQGDWESIEQANDERIVNTLAMLCPFSAEEKQGLLECATLADRAKAMTGFCEARTGGGEPPPGALRH